MLRFAKDISSSSHPHLTRHLIIINNKIPKIVCFIKFLLILTDVFCLNIQNKQQMLNIYRIGGDYDRKH